MTDLPPPPSSPSPLSPPPPSGQPVNYGDAKAQAKAAKAYAKASRPWYKKKRFILGGVGALFVIIAAIGSGAGEDEGGEVLAVASSTTGLASEAPAGPAEPGGTEASQEAAVEPAEPTVVEVSCTPENGLQPGDTKRQGLFPGRPNVQAEDHEAEVGSCVRLAGYTAFLLGGAILGQDFGDPQIVIDVRVLNRDDSTQSFNTYHWSMLTPTGQVVDPTIFFGDGGLGSGDIVKGGEASGKIAFDQNQPGTYYVIFKPDMFNAVRGIWKLEL